ncbi:MAG: hypothetical protein LUG45_02615 [Clostridiales bacterium]|nr:hypothetical protein [Clostridiales bacterium]
MGNKNKNSTVEAILLIVCLAGLAGIVYGIFSFVRWCVEMLHQFYLSIGGALGLARPAALLLAVCLAVLAWVICEQWAARIFTALACGTATAGIAAWFVSSISLLPHFFFLGIALYCGSTVLLLAWEQCRINFTEIWEEIKAKLEEIKAKR